MSIQRGYIPRTDHFTIVPNDWMRDPNLSYRAKGLLAHLMTHQVGWSISTEALMRCGTEGRDAIRTAIRELETHGYLVREQVRDEHGKLNSMSYTLTDPTETPQPEDPHDTPDELADSPATDNPTTGNPTTVNPHPKKTNSKEDHLEEHLCASPPGEDQLVLVEEPPSATASDMFEQFWQAYPKRTPHSNPKKPAREKFMQIVKKTDPQLLIDAAHAYAKVRRGQDPHFTAQAIKWLRDERWNDEVVVPIRPKAQPQPEAEFVPLLQRHRETIQRRKENA